MLTSIIPKRILKYQLMVYVGFYLAKITSIWDFRNSDCSFTQLVTSENYVVKKG